VVTVMVIVAVSTAIADFLREGAGNDEGWSNAPALKFWARELVPALEARLAETRNLKL